MRAPLLVALASVAQASDGRPARNSFINRPVGEIADLIVHTCQIACTWIVKVPVYTPAGSEGVVLRLMLKFIVSVRLPCLLLPRIGTVASCNPALAPPKGTALVSARKAPPFSET